MSRCDEYLDRFYTVDELIQEYKRGRSDAVDEILKNIDDIIQTKPVLPQFEIFLIRKNVKALKGEQE